LLWDVMILPTHDCVYLAVSGWGVFILSSTLLFVAGWLTWKFYPSMVQDLNPQLNVAHCLIVGGPPFIAHIYLLWNFHLRLHMLLKLLQQQICWSQMILFRHSTRKMCGR
jgi:hypothetical protein